MNIEYPQVLIVLATSEKLYARFLRSLMGSKFHHSFLFVKLPEFGGWMAIDVDKYGPHLVHPRKVFKKITRFKCYYSPENLFKGIEKCREFMDAGYDKKGAIFGVLFLLIKKLFRIKIEKAIQDPFKAYCLEYIALVLKHSNVLTFVNVDPSTLTISELERMIEEDVTIRSYFIGREELIRG